MKEIYSLGEQEPWRLTKDSAQRLLFAVCHTKSEIITASIDRTCPPTYACIRIRIDEDKVKEFLHHFGDSLDAVEVAMGQDA